MTLLAAGALYMANPAAAAVSDDAILAACRGDDIIGVTSVRCEYKISRVIERERRTFFGIGGTHTSNCTGQNDAEISVTGTFNRTKSWSVNGSGGLDFFGIQISGGGDYGESREVGVSVGHAFVVPAGKKGQATFAQLDEVSEGTMHVEMEKVASGQGGSALAERTIHDIAMRDVKIPILSRTNPVEVEIADCGVDFRIAQADPNKFLDASAK